MLQGRERDLRNENASLNIFLNFKRERDYSLISKERGIISTQIGKASVDEMKSPNTELRSTVSPWIRPIRLHHSDNRSEVTFPSCWDGRLDTEDMVGDPHVVYPQPGWAAGVCPESHSKRLPTVFFEALFRPGGIYQPWRPAPLLLQ